MLCVLYNIRFFDIKMFDLCWIIGDWLNFF
nr:MAG TPA: hypothetical protein [Caudoviricetes sp.]